MRLGIVDLGTNSAKLGIIQLQAGSPPQFLYRQREGIRLGQGVFQSGRLDPERSKKALKTLKKFSLLCQNMRVEKVLAFATCALREAKDRSTFVRNVRQNTGIQIKIISGQEEARLIALSLIREFPSHGQRQVFIDIGGGSTEIIIVENNEILMAKSLPLGAVRLTNQFIERYPVSKATIHELQAFIQVVLKKELGKITKKFDRAIGSSGTIRALSTWNQVMTGSPEAHTPISVRDLHDRIKDLRTMTPPQMAGLPGVGSSRADVILAGSVILEEILYFLNLEEVIPSPTGGVLEGMIIDQFGQGAISDNPNDPQQEHLQLVGNRYRFDQAHAQKVTQLAIQIFDQGFAFHGITDPRARHWLFLGAMLHDIGQFIDYEKHHRHSQYIIMHDRELKLTNDERIVAGLLARYHRKGTPKPDHQIYRDCSKELQFTIVRLSAILRIADSLDRGHQQLVDRIESVTMTADEVVIAAESPHAIDQEEKAFIKKSELANSLSGRIFKLTQKQKESSIR